MRHTNVILYGDIRPTCCDSLKNKSFSLHSDAFARVIITNQAQETQVIDKTRSPTWDNMLKFENIEFWGDPEEFAVNPPVIVIEIFDMDKELIGSVWLTFLAIFVYISIIYFITFWIDFPSVLLHK